MDEETFIILEYLYSQTERVSMKEKDVPANIRTTFTFYGDGADTMHRQLYRMIQKDLISSKSEKYAITDNGKTAFEKVNATRKTQEYVSELKFQELSKRVAKLDADLDDARGSTLRSKWAIGISIALLIVTLIRLLMGK